MPPKGWKKQAEAPAEAIAAEVAAMAGIKVEKAPEPEGTPIESIRFIEPAIQPGTTADLGHYHAGRPGMDKLRLSFDGRFVVVENTAKECKPVLVPMSNVRWMVLG